MKPPGDRTGGIVIVGRGEHFDRAVREVNEQLADDLHERSDRDDVLDQVRLLADADQDLDAVAALADRRAEWTRRHGS